MMVPQVTVATVRHDCGGLASSCVCNALHTALLSPEEPTSVWTCFVACANKSLTQLPGKA